MPHRSEMEALRLAYMLWDEGFVVTLPPSAAANTGKRSKAQGAAAGPAVGAATEPNAKKQKKGAGAKK